MLPVTQAKNCGNIIPLSYPMIKLWKSPVRYSFEIYTESHYFLLSLLSPLTKIFPWSNSIQALLSSTRPHSWEGDRLLFFTSLLLIILLSQFNQNPPLISDRSLYMIEIPQVMCGHPNLLLQESSVVDLARITVWPSMVPFCNFIST